MKLFILFWQQWMDLGGQTHLRELSKSYNLIFNNEIHPQQSYVSRKTGAQSLNYVLMHTLQLESSFSDPYSEEWVL